MKPVEKIVVGGIGRRGDAGVFITSLRCFGPSIGIRDKVTKLLCGLATVRYIINFTIRRSTFSNVRYISLGQISESAAR